MDKLDSKQYSWAWVTADRLLSHGPAELLYALFVPSASATATATIHDGESTSGNVIVAFRTAQSNQAEFDPPEPIYCRKGIFVDDIANVKGVFVQWRERRHEEGG